MSNPQPSSSSPKPSKKSRRKANATDNKTSPKKTDPAQQNLEIRVSNDFTHCAPAGLLRRWAAAVYDFLILVAIWLLVGFVFMATVLGGKPAENAFILQAGLFPLLVTATLGFYSWFWMHGGQTLGMRAWKIKVVHARLDGSPVVFTQCLMRCFMGIFSWAIFGIGYFWLYTDPSKDTWHDRFSGTRTVIIPKEKR